MKRSLKIPLVGFVCFLLLIASSLSNWKIQAAQLPTILFVTQPPFGADFITVNATFGNHQARTAFAPRGGDLYIRYSDGTLRNLTAEAGWLAGRKRNCRARTKRSLVRNKGAVCNGDWRHNEK